MNHDVALTDGSLLPTEEDDAALEQALAELESALEASDPDRASSMIGRHREFAEELETYRANRAAIDELARPLLQAARGIVEPPEIDGYQVLGLHDEGGMGFIYRAHYQRLNQVVALKVMRDDRPLSEEDKRRFQTEARCAADLDHPSIISVHDIGHQGAHDYYSMELVSGESLKVRLEDRGKFDPHDAAEMMHNIADAMGYAHGKGVVHRDLKPANILIGHKDHPYIIDFGLARHESRPDAIAAGTFVGTPFYCAPEQAEFRAHQAGPAADVYSLGAMLYEMLTGQPPLLGANMQETLEKVCLQDPPHVRQHDGRIKPTLAAICTRCLQKRPEDRYPNAHELAEDLLRFLNGKKLSAATQRFQNWDWPWASDEAYREHISTIGNTLLIFLAVYAVCIAGVQTLLVFQAWEPLAWLLAFGGLVPLFLNLKTDDTEGFWPSNRPERMLWSIWIAVILAHFLLLVALRIRMGYATGFHYTYAVLPFMVGVAFFIMGASFWKTNLLWGLLWMGYGVGVVSLSLERFSPIAFVAFCAVAILNLVLLQWRRNRPAREERTRQAVTKQTELFISE